MNSAAEVSASRITVLLAEDEPMLRQVVGATLRQDGFEVIEAGDGEAGLQVLQSPRRVDILLTDVKMPGLNGYQLAEAAMSLRPEMRILFMTGYADETVPDAIVGASIPILRKPFDFDNLAQSVRDALNA